MEKENKKKDEKEKSVKKKNKTKDNKINGESIKKFISSYRFLYGALGVLLVTVIVLGVLVFAKSRDVKKLTSDLVFPIMEKGIHNSMSIDLYELAKEDDYTIKISNFRGENVNKESLTYTLNISSDKLKNINIYLDGDDKNLVAGSDSTSEIQGRELSGNEKSFDIYHIEVIEKDKISKGDKVSIEINS